MFIQCAGPAKMANPDIHQHAPMSGAHVWLFFSQALAAVDVRRLGSAIISQTCTRNRQLELSTFGRLFPNQDKMPKGDFGNLIALPLQEVVRIHDYIDSSYPQFERMWQKRLTGYNDMGYQIIKQEELFF